MKSLEELQNEYLAAIAASREAPDNDESALWTQLGLSLLNLIGLRMDRGEEGHPDWTSSRSGGTFICEPLSVVYEQQIVRTPFGYCGTGRFTLTTGSGDSAVSFTSHSQTLLKGTLYSYLDRHNAPPEFRHKCETLFKD